MVRRYEDPVEVRPKCSSELSEGDAPGAFLWRGRVYVVRDVLGHWRERRAWWTSSAARAVHGDIRADDTGTEGTRGEGTRAAPARGSGSHASLTEEREVWRVEASPGRLFDSGIYDLCRDSAGGQRDLAPTGDRDGTWRLLRVAD
jgi:hypothetical protein